MLKKMERFRKIVHLIIMGLHTPCRWVFQKTPILIQNSQLNIRKSQLYFRNRITISENLIVFQKMSFV